MALSRRMFFGAAAGAGVAGPSMAKQAMVEGSNMLRGGSALLGGLNNAKSAAAGYAMDTVSQAASGDWRLGRVAELKKLITGEVDPEAMHRAELLSQHLDNIEFDRLTTLKSMSQVQKGHMLLAGMAKRRAQAQRIHAEQELASLEEEMFKFPWSG